MLKDDLVNLNIIREIRSDTSVRINCRTRLILEKNPHILEELLDATSFIHEPLDQSLYERIYCICHDITARPLCVVCGSSPVRFRNLIGHKIYSTVCSSACASKLGYTPEALKKRKQTYHDRFGVEHPMKHQDVKDKREQTCLERFGYKVAVMNPAVNEKRLQTNRGRYSADEPMQNLNVKAGYRETSQARYSVDNPGSLKATKLKIRTKLHAKKHENPESVVVKLDNKEWLQNEHNSKPIKQIADELGVTYVTLFRYFKQHDIRTLIHAGPSLAQKEIAKTLKEWGVGAQLNERQLIAPYELDIFCEERRIAIEFDGVYWHSELNGCDRRYHLRKTELCQEQGISLVHIFENEWVYKQQIVYSRLRSLFGLNEKIYARKCKIVFPPKQECINFLQNNHIQGSVPYHFALGLAYNNELVALLTISKPHYTTQYEYELSRFCSKVNLTVVGGASRLFMHFIQQMNPKSVVSYRDKRWGDGNLYQMLGFRLSHNSAPNYFYFENKYPLRLYSRVKFQKHKLSQMLEDFDPALSEWENMVNNNYDRIWDCGNEVWVWYVN